MPDPDQVTIDTTDDSDRWKYVCPKGHRSWVATNFHFWCKLCAEIPSDDVDPEFSELKNAETRETYEREDVTLEDYHASTA